MSAGATDLVVDDEAFDDERPARHRRDPRRIAQAVVLAAPVLWVLVLGWTHRFMTEDGFIYLRYVEQIRIGNGPVFNAGERVEGFTGTLWVVLLVVADLLTPVRLEWLSVGLGLGLTTAGVALAIVGARRLWDADPADTFLVPLGVLVFGALLPVWAYASSGLETGSVFAWLGGCLVVLAGWARRPDARISAPGAALLGLGWLVRPEMVVFSAAFVLLVVVQERRAQGWGGRIRFVAAAVALPVAYQVFRMGYYGSVVANTAIAKEGSAANWSRGWTYLTDFADAYWLWVPALGLLAGGYLPLVAALGRGEGGRRRAVVATFVGCALVNGAYVVAVGGDYHHARMLLPALFALCAPVAVVPATRRHLAAVVVAAWAAVSVVAFRPTQWGEGQVIAHGILAPQTFGDVTRDDFGWGDDGPYNQWYDGPGYYHEGGVLQYVEADLETAPGTPPAYGALWGIGVSAYALGPSFHVLDQMGLTDPVAAHMANQPSSVDAPRFPGHEKPLPAPWVAARVTPPGARPDPADFPSFGNPLIPPTTGAAFQEQVAWARAALRCPEIREIAQAAEAPLTPRRFLRNLLHAVPNTQQRIPPDPEEAYRTLCGGGTPPEVRALRADG